jgi:hypothetical protein
MTKPGWIFGIIALFVAMPVRAEDFKVTVVAILASDRHKEINPKLVQIADEIRKRDQSLTGWKIERTTAKTLKLNQKEAFPLYGDINAEVTVLSGEDKEKSLRLNVKAPHAGEVTYTNKADKFFPIMTRYQTEKDKERLIIAVMVKPVPSKSIDKEKEKPSDKSN